MLPAYSFDISQSESLESDILKVEVLIKRYSFNHKVNWFHLRLVLPLLKSAQGFSNSVTVRGGGEMINFAGGKGIVLWVDENLKRSVSNHSNLFQS